MTTNTTKTAAGASNTNGLHTDTNNSDSGLGEAIDQAHSNVISTKYGEMLSTTSTKLVATRMSPSIVN